MTSMLYTMGVALSRAADNGLAVSLLVDGHWVDGHIAANDGVGVVLESADGQHCVVRTERIAVVRVHAESPYRSLDRGHGPFPGEGGTARPMPGQQPQHGYAAAYA